MIKTRKRLGDILVEEGKITREQLKKILQLQDFNKKKLGEIIVEENILTEDEIIDVLKKQMNLKRVYLQFVDMNPEAIKFVPERLARKHVLIPYEVDEKTLTVAMSDPLNIFAIDDLKISSGREVVATLATKDEILKKLERVYLSRKVEKVAEELNREVREKESSLKEVNSELDVIGNAPSVKLIDTIFKNAVKMRASDIHIEAFEKSVKVRFRIEGELSDVLKTPKESHSALVARIKILADLDISERRLPQDGRIITRIDEEKVDLRVSILPTIHGEKVVIRVLKKEDKLFDFKTLGIKEDNADKIDKMIKSPFGIVLVTGPTGSGKTTSLYTLINKVNDSRKNVITIEDPVEYEIEGINQVSINTKIGLDFSKGLRSILRQDPDIIMLGEIRDGETANIATRAAITGHLVFSTIHTNDTASAIIRLVDMGVKPYLLSTALSGVVAQRLVRKLCPHCKERYNPSLVEQNTIGIEQGGDITLYRKKGCGKCNKSGYYGRVGIYEVMEISDKHREFIQNGASTEEIRRLNREWGFTTLKEEAKKYLLEGEISLEEYAKVAFLD